MLNEAGVHPDTPDPDVVYRVFKEFARQPVEGIEDDTILYEIGIYEFVNRRRTGSISSGNSLSLKMVSTIGWSNCTA